MAKQDYLPRKNAEKAVWAANLKTKIGAQGATIGLSAGDITAVQTASTDIVDATNAIKAALTTKEAAVNAAMAKIDHAEKVIRSLVKRAKTHTAYTPAIGEDLGFEGPENTINADEAKPLINLSKVNDGYRIDFNLKGYFDGVKIYRQIPGGEFLYLATDTSNPYIDTEAVAIGTRYRAVYLLHDAEVGQVSDEVVV